MDTRAAIAPKLQCETAARLARPGDVIEASLPVTCEADELAIAGYVLGEVLDSNVEALSLGACCSSEP